MKRIPIGTETWVVDFTFLHKLVEDATEDLSEEAAQDVILLLEDQGYLKLDHPIRDVDGNIIKEGDTLVHVSGQDEQKVLADGDDLFLGEMWDPIERYSPKFFWRIKR